jgi:predicted lysophospholipase L1 biosynthesis ABC-type transport system permease subunit
MVAGPEVPARSDRSIPPTPAIEVATRRSRPKEDELSALLAGLLFGLVAMFLLATRSRMSWLVVGAGAVFALIAFAAQRSWKLPSWFSRRFRRAAPSERTG